MSIPSNHRYIVSSDELRKFCDIFARSDYIAVDTEFVSERKYWAELCLVQIANEKYAVAVDVKSRGIDLKPMWDLLLNPRIIKVFHACSEDVNIIHHLTGKLPLPLFDTQLASMFCYPIENPGYARLAKMILNVDIDKSQQKTNWRSRPLDERQIAYALSDTTQLIKIYAVIVKKLKELDRTDWIEQEHKNLIDNIKRHHDPFECWRRIHLRHSSPGGLSILREIAAWRELYARKKDLPAVWLLKDNVLADIAMSEPRSESDLDKIRTLPASLKPGSQMRKSIWLAIERAINIPVNERPSVVRKIKYSHASPLLMELLKLALRYKAEEYQLAPSIITNADTLREFVSTDGRDSKLLKGWRNIVFGQTALSIKQGKAGIRYSNGRLVLEGEDVRQNGMISKVKSVFNQGSQIKVGD